MPSETDGLRHFAGRWVWMVCRLFSKYGFIAGGLLGALHLADIVAGFTFGFSVVTYAIPRTQAVGLILGLLISSIVLHVVTDRVPK